VIGRFLKKILYVDAFALILGSFPLLADVIFRSFAGLGVTAGGGTMSADDLLRPGHVAGTGFEAAMPLLEEIAELTEFVTFFENFLMIAVLLIAWLLVILSFFVLAIQLFITVIEFKLTALAGFVLVPFALWNRTSFLAERVLGNVVASGIKVMVLGVIVGIGSGHGRRARRRRRDDGLAARGHGDGLGRLDRLPAWPGNLRLEQPARGAVRRRQRRDGRRESADRRGRRARRRGPLPARRPGMGRADRRRARPGTQLAAHGARRSRAIGRAGGRRVFDDRRQVFVEFPAGLALGEAPPRFVSGEGGGREAGVAGTRDRQRGPDPSTLGGLKPMSELRLRKLPDRTPVRMTVSLPPELNQALLGYAALYGEVYGQPEPLPELIPAMLANFLEADKAYARWRRDRGRQRS
jgi:hypothetical protein